MAKCGGCIRQGQIWPSVLIGSVGELREYLQELTTLGRGQRGEETFLNISDDRVESAEFGLPFPGECNNVAPAVRWVAGTGDEAVFRHLVQRRDDVGGVDASAATEVGLRGLALIGDRGQ